MQLKLISLLGLVVFIAMAWAISANKKKFPWRAVTWGLVLQFVFGFAGVKRARELGAVGQKRNDVAFDLNETSVNEIAGNPLGGRHP